MDNLEELTKILFPSKIESGEVCHLMGHLAKDLDCHADYDIRKRKVTDTTYVDGQDTTRSVDLSGTISKNKVLAISSFEGISVDDRLRIAGMGFFVKPGYTLDELDPNEVNLWREVKAWVPKYFSEFKK